MVNGRVKKVICDGYERYINILCEKKEIGSVWCYFVDDEYIETSTDKSSINVDDRLNFEIQIDLVSDFIKVENEQHLCLKQPIDESSHVEVTALVCQIIDDYSLVCNMGILDEIIVEFESKITQLHLGDTIKFKGNLKIEIM